MGRLKMVIEPTITMTMEITIATMGRFIKNFDIASPSRGFRGGKGLRVHLHSGTHLLNALGNYAIAALQSVRNDPLVADDVAHRDGPDAHFVLAVQHRHLIGALQL